MVRIGKLGERRYQARWVDPNGRECSKIFTRRTIAEDKITEVEASKLDDSYVDHKNKITVAKYARDRAAGLQAVKIPQPREGDEPERDGARRTAGRNRNVR
jgi:hypothetical protein